MEHIKLSQLLEISSYDNLFQIVVLNAQDTLQEALRKFSGHKILSAPVRIERNHTTTYRMFDVMDAVLAMIQQDCDSSVLRKSIENFCSKHSGFTVFNFSISSNIFHYMTLPK